MATHAAASFKVCGTLLLLLLANAPLITTFTKKKLTKHYNTNTSQIQLTSTTCAAESFKVCGTLLFPPLGKFTLYHRHKKRTRQIQNKSNTILLESTNHSVPPIVNTKSCNEAKSKGIPSQFALWDCNLDHTTTAAECK